MIQILPNRLIFRFRVQFRALPALFLAGELLLGVGINLSVKTCEIGVFAQKRTDDLVAGLVCDEPVAPVAVQNPVEESHTVCLILVDKYLCYFSCFSR